MSSFRIAVLFGALAIVSARPGDESRKHCRNTFPELAEVD
jgi:hypothetical protein